MPSIEGRSNPKSVVPAGEKGSSILSKMGGGVVDYKGRPISSSTTTTTTTATGGWTAALFIIGVEVAERFTYGGIASNLISYLTGPLRQSTAAGAANANAWTGTANMLPILGAVVADSWLGRYRTVLVSSLLYVLGLGLLTLSAALLSLGPSACTPSSKGEPSSCPPPSPFLVTFFFFSLYLVALGQGGHKPCVEAFGADQFDSRDPSENRARSSFFNWWYVGICLGSVAAYVVLNYVQDYVSWAVAFGLQCTAMLLALVVFQLGTKTYRYLALEDQSPLVRIAEVCVEAVWNREAPASTFDEAGETLLLHEETQFESLDRKAAVVSDNYRVTLPSKQVDSIPSNSLTKEEVKGMVQLLPIWLACLIYGTVFAQRQTLFTKQGNTMERDMGFGYQIPAASLQLCSSGMVIIFVPVYDFILVPIARKFSGNPSGITMLQRIGIGLVLSAASMVSAALVEMRRLKIARDFGLVDVPNVPVPMSVWWLVPQYAVSGISEVFTMIGMQEFFYDQMPSGLRSVGLALYLSVFGIGSFLSSFLISVIDSFTVNAGESWFANNINRGHLDYFFWLLAGLNFAGCLVYAHFAKLYIYKKI